MLHFDKKNVGPLNSVKVLDLSRLVAGNMLSLQLGDFGCDVIKLEPRSGDPLRAWTESGIASFWKVYCRNKRSVAINFRSSQAKEIILRLAKTADVLIESFRPGKLEEMGIGPKILHLQNPNLVIVRISGFGQTGPYRDRPGFGTLVEAMSGFASRNGFEDRPPLLPPLALADMITGLQGAYATMVALREVELKQVEGQIIDLSLLEPIISTLGPEALSYQLTNKVKKRMGNRSNTSAPRDIYRTKDNKFVALSASIQVMAERVFKAIGKPGMIKDPRFKTNSDRVKNCAVVNDIVSSWVLEKKQEEVLKIFIAAGITVSAIYDIKALLEDKHTQEREVFVDMEDDDLGVAEHHNISPRMSKTPGTFRRPAPMLGEHTDEVLSESGFKIQEILELREQGII